MDFMLRLSFRPINASKELATSAVEVLAHRPEKKRRRGSSVPLQFSCYYKLALAKASDSATKIVNRSNRMIPFMF